MAVGTIPRLGAPPPGKNVTAVTPLLALALRAISSPPVPHLSLAPLMIVIRDLMTRVRFAFCMPPSSPAGSYG